MDTTAGQIGFVEESLSFYMELSVCFDFLLWDLTTEMQDQEGKGEINLIVQQSENYSVMVKGLSCI